jgi:phosphoglycerate dehydrogenase-like enzyme
MPRPRVYIHRIGSQRFPRYLDRQALADLEGFAEAVSDGPRDTGMTATELVARLRGCEAILSLCGGGAHEITSAVLREAGTVRAVCIAHWCCQLADDAAAAGVPVVEGSNANTVAVAEWTLAAALSGVRRLHVFDGQLKAGSPWAEPRLAAGMLAGSVVGLVGLGRIGRYVARMFRVLGLEVIAYDPGVTPAQGEELGVRQLGLDEVLRAADLVSLHLPVTDGTRGIIGAERLAMLRDGCVLINSARAALCDEPALVAELGRGRIGAVLDVFAEEPLPLAHPLRRLGNVLLTPHIAGDNLAMSLRCGREAVGTLRRFFAGEGLHDQRYRFP